MGSLTVKMTRDSTGDWGTDRMLGNLTFCAKNANKWWELPREVGSTVKVRFSTRNTHDGYEARLPYHNPERTWADYRLQLRNPATNKWTSYMIYGWTYRRLLEHFEVEKSFYISVEVYES